jgi:hypothetical protein
MRKITEMHHCFAGKDNISGICIACLHDKCCLAPTSQVFPAQNMLQLHTPGAEQTPLSWQLKGQIGCPSSV